MAGNFGNAEAPGRPVAPGGFNPRPSPQLAGFVEFGEATFRAGATEAERPRDESALLGSLVYRPTIFRRNDVGWIAACAWRAAAKVDDIAALKRAKRELDRRLINGAAELVAALVYQLHGEPAADTITCVPCGHSRRPDCLGKQIAQAVAEALGLKVQRSVTSGARVRQIPRDEAEIAVECLRDWGISARILEDTPRSERPAERGAAPAYPCVCRRHSAISSECT